MIVRRPHAYRFLQQYLPELERQSRDPEASDDSPEIQVIIGSGDPSALTGEITLPDGSTIDASEVVVIDASEIPIPGLVILDAEGRALGNVSFLAGLSRQDLLDFLHEHAN